MRAKKIELHQVYRSRGEYTAKLFVYGVKVGRVERGLTTGFGRNEYRAIVEMTTVASGRTLADMREELTEWIEEERQMEDDAIWVNPNRSGGR